MNQNERGITLIEVLVSIVILSIIGTVIWNVLFQGSSYSKTAVSKNLMLEEANTTMASLNRIYQTSASFSFSNTPGCQITVTYKKDLTAALQTQVFNNSQMCFTVKPSSATSNPNGAIQIEILINDIHNKNNLVDVGTTLYRLKESSS